MHSKRISVILMSVVAVLYCSFFAYHAIQQSGWEREATKWVGDRANYLIILLIAFAFIGLVLWEFLRTMMNLKKDQSLRVARIFGDIMLSLVVFTIMLSILNDYILGDRENVFLKIGTGALIIFAYSLERIFGGWDKLVDRWT